MSVLDCSFEDDKDEEDDEEDDEEGDYCGSFGPRSRSSRSIGKISADMIDSHCLGG